MRPEWTFAMGGWGYLLLGLGSLTLSVIGVLCAFFNPVMFFLHLAAPFARLFGRQVSLGGWSSLDSVIPVALLWPLVLAPMHWLNFRVLRWNGWGYLGLLLLAGVLIAFIVLLRVSAVRIETTP